MASEVCACMFSYSYTKLSVLSRQMLMNARVVYMAVTRRSRPAATPLVPMSAVVLVALIVEMIDRHALVS